MGAIWEAPGHGFPRVCGWHRFCFLILLGSRQANLDELDRAAHSVPLDRAALNAALRVLMSAVVVNFLAGYLVFQWQFGEETQLFWAWPKDEEVAVAAA